jgi:hypothetical protein
MRGTATIPLRHLDIEGADAKALKGFPLRRSRRQR